MPAKICCMAVTIAALITACKSSDRYTQVNANSASAATSPIATPSATSTAPASTVVGKMDACTLLTNDDLKSVQGESPTQALRSERSDGGFIVAQCYYSLPTVSSSVVLNVTTAAEGASGRSPREFWMHAFASEEKGKERDRESKERKGEEEESAKPEKVSGLGDDAYWAASRVGGALYVLRKDLFFRISIGGAGDVKTKLTKSKTLARKILQRL